MAKIKNIPELRFPEFTDNWDSNLFGNIASFNKGKGVSKADIVEDGETECIRYGELYTTYNEVINDVRSKTNIPVADLILSEKNDVIIPASGETQIDIARASCVIRSGIALGGDLNIIKSKLNGTYLAYYLNNTKKKEIAALAQGNSVVHLYSSQLKTLSINYPKPQEQEKIATFLMAIDKRISLLNQQKEQLELYKKGLMQKIFSRKIRFKDENGNDFPEWKEKELGKLCKITTGKVDANAMIENGKYRFYTCAKDYFQIDEYAFDTEALLISGNGANVGYVHHYKGKFNAYQRTYVLDGFKENIIYIKYFLLQFLSKRIMSEKNEGNTPYIVLSTLSDMKIQIPSFTEQCRISDLLLTIDQVISQTNYQIDKMKEFKKGLFQKIFV